MKKSKLIVVGVFLLGCIAGGACMYLWQQSRPSKRPYFGRIAGETVCGRGCLGETPLPLIPIEEGVLPEGIQEVQQNQPLKSSAELPSQLVRSDLPEDIVLGAVPADTAAGEEKPSGIVLSDGQNTVVLNSQKPAQRATDGTNITLIEAPVQVKRIKTLEDYKAFKRSALGSYPTADFSKEEVVVLESQSNLPDKVFEIVRIEPDGESLKLSYRVNVFGLDKKTNTHSAQKIKKSKADIVLEQVL